MPKSQAKTEVARLLTVIGSAVLAALILSGSLLYFYNPAGSYLTQNILYEPEVLQNLSFKEKPSQNAPAATYVFEGVELADQGSRISVPLDRYARFYEGVSGRKSVPGKDLETLFYRPDLSVMTIYVRPASQPQALPYPMQRVEFSSDDEHFRVEIRQDQQEEWAYFSMPGILSKVQRWLVD